MLRPLAAAFVLSVAGPATALAGDSIRCNTSLIDVGQSALELQAACGVPDHVDRRTVVHSVERGIVLGATDISHIYEEIETWTYSGGSGRLMRIIEIKRGLIVDIRTVAVRGARDLGRCQRGVFGEPALSGQVEITCGAPDDRSRWIEERVLRDREGREHRFMVTFERWIYVPGPGRLIRIFEFENGQLVKEATGARAPE